MIASKWLLVVLVCLNGRDAQQQTKRRFRGLPMPSGLKLKQRWQEKLNQHKQRNTQVICYDLVGCFELPHRRSPLQKVPQNPDTLDTKFYLFRKNMNFSHPQLLRYDDGGKTLAASKFNYSEPMKMFIHGYLGKWNFLGNLIAVETYLNITDCNVILMDWEMGARGPQYIMAAANTEVVGRQLGILLSMMVDRGLDPALIHLIGFSLGAHVAGSSSEVLKKKGFLIGRISGLDAASPLFRTDHLREKHKKLDREDARLVDVVHTDSSPSVTDGFGLWQPVGHVDYFPNGGQQQPGCTDTEQSIIVSHFDRSLTKDIACSHIRAWRLFQETLVSKAANVPNQCEFVAFGCPGGLKSFERGHCFPSLPKPNSSLALDAGYRSEIGRFGEDVKGEGIMFFVTRNSQPYCGTQLQASVHVSPETGSVNGYFQLSLLANSSRTTFQIDCEISDTIMTGNVMSGLAAIDFNSLENVNAISATLQFTDLAYEENNTYVTVMCIDKIVVRDMFSNSWQFCKRKTMLQEGRGLGSSTISVILSNTMC